MSRKPIWTVALMALGFGGCGRQSVLAPRSEPAREIATLWWWMLVAGAIVFTGAVGLLLLAWWRRGRGGLPWIGNSEMKARGMVVTFGILLPVVVLVAVFVVANFAVAAKTDAPARGTDPLRIDVIGHQWWWEARYPATGAVTANEIHIPVRTKVEVTVATDDVIHSFWVPQLNRKIDLIPGERNRVELYADQPGSYRGQCAEYCGLQHAHMGLMVIAQPAGDFERWLHNEAAGRVGKGEGFRTFMAVRCASCHAIRGTGAEGTVGPDLTHVGARATLAALTIPNSLDQMIRWLRNPQAVKYGVRMPAVGMTAGQRLQIARYLEGLK